MHPLYSVHRYCEDQDEHAWNAKLLLVANTEETKKDFIEKARKAMDLIVEGKGLFIGKHQGRICVSRQQKTVQETPLIHLKQIIVVDSGIAISSDVVRMCTEVISV